jgi:hypothetical protein
LFAQITSASHASYRIHLACRAGVEIFKAQVQLLFHTNKGKGATASADTSARPLGRIGICLWPAASRAGARGRVGGRVGGGWQACGTAAILVLEMAADLQSRFFSQKVSVLRAHGPPGPASSCHTTPVGSVGSPYMSSSGVESMITRWLQIARMLPVGPGGLQSGFSVLRYVRRGFRKTTIGSANSPPPRWSPGPGPGFLSVARGRAA